MSMSILKLEYRISDLEYEYILSKILSILKIEYLSTTV